MTDKPFGVNLEFLPTLSAPPYPKYIAAIVEGGVKIVETAGRSREPYMPPSKGHQGHSQMHLGSPCVDSFECGGHPGASGGMPDARSLIAP